MRVALEASAPTLAPRRWTSGKAWTITGTDAIRAYRGTAAHPRKRAQLPRIARRCRAAARRAGTAGRLRRATLAPDGQRNGLGGPCDRRRARRGGPRLGRA